MSKALASTARPRSRNPVWTPQLRDRFAIAESIALTTYPWDRLTLETQTIDAVLGLPADVEARLPRAIFWAMHQLFGEGSPDAYSIFFPSMSRPPAEDEWLGVYASSPLTVDEKTVGGIVALLEAARRLLVDEPLAERNWLRNELIAVARQSASEWPIVFEEARRGLDGLALIDLGGGWVRIEEPASTAAVKRLLERNWGAAN